MFDRTSRGSRGRGAFALSVLVVGLPVLILLATGDDPPPVIGSDSPRTATEHRAPPVEVADAPVPEEPAPPPAKPVPEISPRDEAKGAITASVRLARAGGEPVVGGKVVLLVQEKGRQRRVDAKAMPGGVFEVSGVPAHVLGGTVQFEAGASGFMMETYRMHGEQLAREVTLVLRPPIRMRGRFVDEEGKPVAGSRLDGWHGSWTPVHAVSDEEGRFEYLAPSKRGLGLYLTHRAAPRGLLWSPASTMDVDLGDVVVPRGRPIHGRVLAPDGTPVAAQQVQLFTVERWGRLAVAKRTDAEGKFWFGNLGGGLFEVFVSRPGEIGGRKVTLGTQASGLKAGCEPLSLTLRPVHRLLLRMHDAHTRKPAKVVNLTTRIRRVGAAVETTSWRQTRGHVQEGTRWIVEPGEYEVIVETALRRRRTYRVNVPDEDEITLDVEMWPKEDG
jgi:hypothetical protein